MNILAAICLSTALLASPMASHADSLDDLDRLLENVQRKREKKEMPGTGVHGPSDQSPSVPDHRTGEVREFGSDDFRFTLEIPAGWNAKGIERGVQVENGDGSSYFDYRKMDTGPLSASEFASAIGRKFGVEIKKQDDIWSFTGEKDGSPLIIVLTPDEENSTCIVFIGAGTDWDGLRRIFRTVKIISDKK